jgi:hypothetical protein
MKALRDETEGKDFQTAEEDASWIFSLLRRHVEPRVRSSVQQVATKDSVPLPYRFADARQGDQKMVITQLAQKLNNVFNGISKTLPNAANEGVASHDSNRKKKGQKGKKRPAERGGEGAKLSGASAASVYMDSMSIGGIVVTSERQGASKHANVANMWQNFYMTLR